MFEKESKEYAIGLTYPKFQDNQIANMVLRDVEGGFQKGAEFGYNKAKIEVETESNQLFLQGAKRVEELEKENKELKEKLKPENCLKSLAKSRLVKFTCENGNEHGNEHDQLTKAIEIITNLVKFDGSYKDDEEYQRKSELYDEIWEQAEDFLKECK